LSETPYNNKKILLAEDNPINREMVKIILSNFSFTVKTAENGLEVLEILKNDCNFDLIILDINMPKLNGIETAKAIRQSQTDSIKNIPITALTGNETKSEIDSIFNSGINSYIPKPATPEALMEVIDKTIKNPDYSNKEIKNKNFVQDVESEKTFVQPPDQDEIDIEKGMFYVGNDFNIFKKLLLRFYKNYTGYTDKINKFIEKKEKKNLKFAIHNLKGVSAQICAAKLNKETKNLEDLFKNNENIISRETITPLETHFKKTMEAIEKILKSELETSPEENSEPVKKANPQILKKNLLRLATCLKQSKIKETQEALSEIKNSSLNQDQAKLFNEIKIFTKNHDFESALLRVKTFLKLL
jgi:CheY-like chemotaxis protein